MVHDKECRICGSFSAGIERIDDQGTYYECRNCSYDWFVPNIKSNLKRILAAISFGFISAR
jgi:DNA-directed RNA polymerase subunit RPC12/RpoP